MGDVVPFQARRGKPRADADSGPHAGEAQILFFLGVRYARLDDARPESAAPDAGDAGHAPRGGRKRKNRVRAG